MTTKTSTQTGKWATGSTWVGGVAPVDGDSVAIAAGHTVTFDANMSAWANGVNVITVTGTLNFETLAGTYYLKMSNGVTGAGTISLGTLATPLPFAAKHTIGGSSVLFNGALGLTLNAYAAEPNIKTVRLTGDAAISATRLYVDTDITGDIWAVGDTINIVNINKVLDTETRVIAAITSTYIDITVGLTAAKITGAYVALMTRNLLVLGAGASVTTITGFLAVGRINIGGGQWVASVYRLFSTKYSNISGGTFTSPGQYLFVSLNQTTITGGVFVVSGSSMFNSSGNNVTISGAFIGGHAVAFNYQTGIRVSNTIIAGCGNVFNTYGFYAENVTVIGCTSVGSSTFGVLRNCTLLGNTNALYRGKYVLIGCTLTNNTYDMLDAEVTSFNCTSSGSTAEFSAYNQQAREELSEAINYNTAGGYKAWSTGGVTTSVTTTPPAGFSRSYQLVLESATIEGHWDRQIMVPAHKSVTITMYLRKNISTAYLPRAWTFLVGDEPFDDATKILNEFVMTNSTATWEIGHYTYTNTDDYDKGLKIRFLGKDASAVMLTQLAVNFNNGISRSRVLAGAG